MGPPTRDSGEKIMLLGATQLHEPIIGSLLEQGIQVLSYTDRPDNFLPRNTRQSWITDECVPALYPDQVFWLDERHYVFAQRILGNALESEGRWRNELNDKWFQRQRLAQMSSRPVRSEILSGSDDVLRKIESFGSDFVVKPRLISGGSRGVGIFAREDIELGAKWARKLLFEGLDPLLEEFVSGEEFCVDGFVNRGDVKVLGVGKYQKTSWSQTLVSRISYEPLGNDEDRLYSIEMERICEVLGYSRGPVHAEFREEKEGGLYTVEVHGRFGGSLIPEALEIMCGISPFIYGKQVDSLPVRSSESVSISFVYGSQMTRSLRISETDSELGRLELFEVPAGASLSDLMTDRFGYVISRGPSLDEATQRNDSILASHDIHL